MKKTLLLIALAMIAVLSAVSCKNNKKASSSENDVIEEQKTVFAEDVLATVDEYAAALELQASNGFEINLSEAEKMAKPDYLIDPAIVNGLVTKTQKVNALAFLSFDRIIRVAYDMPVAETDEAITKLAVDINFPINNEADASEIIKKQYEAFKERGEIQCFWQYYFALYVDACYICSQNPDLFFAKHSEDDFFAFDEQWISVKECIKYLANYDSEMAALEKFMNDTAIVKSEDEAAVVFSSAESAKEVFKTKAAEIKARRDALLQ